MEFERRIEDWTEEEKKDQLKKWELEEEAMMARLVRDSRKLRDDVQRIVEVNRMKSVAVEEEREESVGVSRREEEEGGKGKGKGGREVESAKEVKGKDEKVERQSVPSMFDLRSLQEQLQASINTKKTK